MTSSFDKSKVKKYTLDPYSARALILQLEMQYDLAIRVYDSHHHCTIHIDKEEQKDDSPILPKE